MMLLKLLKADVTGNMIVSVKWLSVKNRFFDKLSSVLFIPERIFSNGHIYIAFAMPRMIKSNYNWGDDINFVFGEIISGKKVIPYRYSLFPHINYLFIGSIIQWYCNERSIIWGAGLLHPIDSLKKPKKILAVRGPLTREQLLKCGIECPEVYGDPALLFPLIYQPHIEKKFKIGIILHYSELNKVTVKLPVNISVSEVLFIDIAKYGYWKDFIDKIYSCEIILSSSLHGIIISEAYMIPTVWTSFDEFSSKKSNFKYLDYYHSVSKYSIKHAISYSELLIQNDLVYFVKKKWIKPQINLTQLINSCPFKLVNQFNLDAIQN